MLDQAIAFGPFRLNPLAGLTQGRREIRLTPKAFALLCLLAGERGRVVSKEELFDTLWPRAPVGDAALVTCIQELRKALRDNARRPRYIQTLHRRGYRFIAEPASASLRDPGGLAGPVEAEQAIPVGRGSELAQLDEALAAARGGKRQVVMVTGEAGIGKTTLVRAFLARAAQAGDLRIAWGESAEHYGASEPYHSLLDALVRACRAPWGEGLLRALDQHAPLWLAQMPALAGPSRLRALQRRTAGATRERMHRELTEALEAAVAASPIVLWLEDLHWADVSTIDWLAAFARRPEAARLLVVGTYRSDEAHAEGHPVHAMRDELRRHGHCRELALGPLQSSVVAEYVCARFTPSADAVASLSQLATEVHRRTGGSPLFMVGVLNELVAKGVLACLDGAWSVRHHLGGDELTIPQDLSQAIDRQIDRLRPAAARLLEVASAAGLDFSAAAVAAGAGRPSDEVERVCHDLARQYPFLHAAGVEEWPDGTVASRFRFAHALYREALYERLPAGRRAELHRRIGERLARGYGDRADDIATQLALHFERGRDAARAVVYLRNAGETAVRRSASREAAAHFGRALDLLRTLPHDRSRDQTEVAVRLALSAPLIAMHGLGSTLVEACVTEARTLCDELGDRHGRFAAHRVIWNHRLMRDPVPTALRDARELMAEAEASQDAAELALAHRALGTSLVYAGQLGEGERVLGRGIALADRTPDADFAAYGEHPGMICRVFAAWANALMGLPEQAAQFAESGVEHARRRDDPHSLAFALVTVGLACLFQRDVDRASLVAGEVLALSQEYELPQWIAFAQEIQGWVDWQRGDPASGIELIGQALERLRATGARTHSSRMLANLAECCLAGGKPETARLHLEAAFVHRSRHGEHYYAAELYRLRALILERGGAPREAVAASLAEALATARSQGAGLLAARAAQTLA
jgi:DNA-binding winged helix-turn-helix (wHTH) protein/tetratricopeptide (TPR) repeat protein